MKRLSVGLINVGAALARARLKLLNRSPTSGDPTTLKFLCIELTALAFVFTQMVSAAITTNYVAHGGQTPSDPYTTWDTAASNIQDAISVATGAGSIVLVSNGVYETGGVTNWPAGTVLTNRVAITNAITVRSANNDPTNTIIKGAWDPVTTNGPAAVRCVYMVAGSKLIGFMLTNGGTLLSSASYEDQKGGGVHCPSITSPIISNCIIAGNSAAIRGGGAFYGSLYSCTLSGNSSGNRGGGVSYGNLYNCTLSGNSASNYGGGAFVDSSCILSNCTLSGNSAGDYGGGAAGGTPYGNLYNCMLSHNLAGNYGGGAAYENLYNCTIVSNYANYGGGVQLAVLCNCIVYFNRKGTTGSNWYDSTQCIFTNSCTAPTTTVWAAGNITADPMFVNKDAGNWRLANNSPCINTGTNQNWMTNSFDLDGRTRIRYGTVDMGAYELIYGGTLFRIP